MEYTAYIMPELLILVPVLIIIGNFLKSTKFDDNNIPIALGLAGVMLAMLYVTATASAASDSDIATAIFTASVQGILCAGLAVYGHQIVKQISKD